VLQAAKAQQVTMRCACRLCFGVTVVDVSCSAFITVIKIVFDILIIRCIGVIWSGKVVWVVCFRQGCEVCHCESEAVAEG